MKKASLVLRIIAAAFILIGFLTLTVSSTASIKVETWGSNGYDRIDLDPEFSYSSYNFFERMDKLDSLGFSHTTETLIVVGMIATIVILLLSFGVDFFKGFYCAAIPLILIILGFVYLSDSSTGYVFDYEYLGYVYGYSVSTQSVITFYYSSEFITTILTFFVAFVLQLLGGIFHMVGKKKARLAPAMPGYAPVMPGYAPQPGFVPGQPPMGPQYGAPTQPPMGSQYGAPTQPNFAPGQPPMPPQYGAPTQPAGTPENNPFVR